MMFESFLNEMSLLIDEECVYMNILLPIFAWNGT